MEPLAWANALEADLPKSWQGPFPYVTKTGGAIPAQGNACIEHSRLKRRAGNGRCQVLRRLGSRNLPAHNKRAIECDEAEECEDPQEPRKRQKDHGEFRGDGCADAKRGRERDW